MFPAEEKLCEIRRALAANRSVVLSAPPGSGKTTCIPPALLGEPWLEGKGIILLEPRRLAARSCAAYMAGRLGESPGGTVGYRVRLEKRVSAKTRLEVVTEGLLAQRLLSDPELSGAGLVIFDEFHERSLPCDLAFALALEVRRALRPDLRIMVMSATLDTEGVAAHLGDAEVVRAEGRMFPVDTRYLGAVPMASAVSAALAETDGDVLCFLPGEREIRREEEALKRLRGLGGVEVLPLFGSLPKAEQDRVFAPSGRRRVVLATSIAETSVTIEGVTAVVDCGLMRVPRHSPRSGMTGLVTLPLTLDRAEQRRGRAGRVRPGVCYRLWSEAEDASRPQRSMPEILDADLAQVVLSSAAWGALRRDDLPWATKPPAASWDAAVSLLRGLGALDERGAPTAKGRAMSSLPMHPRLANMCLSDSGDGRAFLLAAIVEEGTVNRETDIRRAADYVAEVPDAPFSRRVRRLADAFPRGMAGTRRAAGAEAYGDGALLALAYPDRIARNRGNGTFRMVSGRGAFLEDGDPLAREKFLVCCELDDRRGDAKIFLACPVGEDDIESLFKDKIEEVSVCAWDRAAERVSAVLRRKLGAMTLSERPDAAGADPEVVAKALMEGIASKGVENLPCWTKEASALAARVNFLARHCGWPAAGVNEIAAALPPFIGGISKWRDLEKVDLRLVIESIFTQAGKTARELDALAPAKMEVPSGSRLSIRYEGAEPVVEARLQECFGLLETPKVAGGRVPVVMALLSPAHRPVQVTKDLAGFWKGAYQLVRKEMRGRYPRHDWPEDPMSAVATRCAKKRGRQTLR